MWLKLTPPGNKSVLDLHCTPAILFAFTAPSIFGEGPDLLWLLFSKCESYQGELV